MSIALLPMLPMLPLHAQALPAAPASVKTLSWTDWADLALASPAVIIATVDKAGKLSRRAAPDVPAGEVRALIEAQLTAAMKAPTVLPARAEWLWQGASGPRGRPPLTKGAAIIVFAEPVPGSRDAAVQQYRLVQPHAMQPWSAAAETAVRAILVDAAKRENSGLMVTAVTDGFYTAGTVEGRSESQFFLATASGRPATLVVQRSPGAPPAVSLSTGEVIDRATAVAPETLRWRALACGLPASLPDPLGASAELSADYAAVLQSLGRCGRTIGTPVQSLEISIPTARASG